jgi:hypothetical protein
LTMTQEFISNMLGGTPRERYRRKLAVCKKCRLNSLFSRPHQDSGSEGPGKRACVNATRSSRANLIGCSTHVAELEFRPTASHWRRRRRKRLSCSKLSGREVKVSCNLYLGTLRDCVNAKDHNRNALIQFCAFPRPAVAITSAACPAKLTRINLGGWRLILATASPSSLAGMTR